MDSTPASEVQPTAAARKSQAAARQENKAATTASDVDEKKIPVTAVATTSTIPEDEDPSKLSILGKLHYAVVKYFKFIGPGTLLSVAFIDPDNFQTDVFSGAEFQFKLLCVIVVSNIFAIYFQYLALRLGTVTGMNLAQMNKKFLPRWLNFALWAIAEGAIMATDIGQVIGEAIAINLLIPQIPIWAGCLITLADTLIILAFYRPDKSLRGLRLFESFIGLMVIGIIITLCVELGKAGRADAGQVFLGFLPNKYIFTGQGIFQSCAIFGGNLQIHTLYLGSGFVQARLRDYDIRNKLYIEPEVPEGELKDTTVAHYKPSLRAIKACIKVSVAELIVSIFVVATFVNAAILIVAATTFADDDNAPDADLFGLYDVFNTDVSLTAAKFYAVGLLFSGITCSVLATMGGQLIMEGATNWRIHPFARRLFTRVIAIIPAIVLAAKTSKADLADALNNTNVVLSVALIFLTAPLVWFTCHSKYMMVQTRVTHLAPDGTLAAVAAVDNNGNVGLEDDTQHEVPEVDEANGRTMSVISYLAWFVIAGMNVALLVFTGLGLGSD